MIKKQQTQKQEIHQKIWKPPKILTATQEKTVARTITTPKWKQN